MTPDRVLELVEEYGCACIELGQAYTAEHWETDVAIEKYEAEARAARARLLDAIGQLRSEHDDGNGDGTGG